MALEQARTKIEQHCGMENGADSVPFSVPQCCATFLHDCSSAIGDKPYVAVPNVRTVRYFSVLFSILHVHLIGTPDPNFVYSK